MSRNIRRVSPFLLAVTVFVVMTGLPIFDPPPPGKTATVFEKFNPPVVNFKYASLLPQTDSYYTMIFYELWTPLSVDDFQKNLAF